MTPEQLTLEHDLHTTALKLLAAATGPESPTFQEYLKLVIYLRDLEGHMLH